MAPQKKRLFFENEDVELVSSFEKNGEWNCDEQAKQSIKCWEIEFSHSNHYLQVIARLQSSLSMVNACLPISLSGHVPTKLYCSFYAKH
jgi:hypothetical protein